MSEPIFSDDLPNDTCLQHRRFRIVRQLGQGSFGIVYEASSTASLFKKVAIKECFPRDFARRSSQSHEIGISCAGDSSNFNRLKEAFRREAEALARCHHESVVPVHDYFEENNTIYLVMGFIEGESLERRMDTASMPLSDEAIQGIFTSLLSALRHIHEHGIYHRDIKPDNIILNASLRPVLIDFGAVRARWFTFTGSKSYPVGNQDYSAPEQYNPALADIGPWTDIYALGRLMHELITGALPKNDRVQLLHEDFPAYPSVMLDAIAQMVRPVPRERPQSIALIDDWLISVNGQLE